MHTVYVIDQFPHGINGPAEERMRFKVYVDYPGRWEVGATKVEALGKLFISHPELFNATIKGL